MKKNSKRKIYIAGAGPGGAELITLKLHRILEKADVVLFDNLVSKSLLSFCGQDARLIDVGKSGRPDSEHKSKQKYINKLLIKYAKQDRVVLRLKGGDPFIFGRGSEECEELSKNKIPFEVIPGISSAIGGPLYAGIPLTHRGLSRSVAIATGHLRKGQNANDIKVPDADTIVFVMGIKNLPILVKKLLAKGRHHKTKCALIERACSSHQRTFVASLDNICKVRDKKKVNPPALFIVGDVVSLRDKLKWFENKPLFGKTILLTRTRRQITNMANRLRDLGADVIESPAIEIVKIKGADRKIKEKGYLDKFTDVIFTSVHGVEIFFNALFSGGRDSRMLHGKTISAIGKMTAKRLQSYGIKADIVPSVFQAEGVLEKLNKNLSGRYFLLPRAQGARAILLEEIRKRGGKIQELLLYVAKAPRKVYNQECGVDIDGICFTSSSTVDNFCNYDIDKKKVKVFAIGEITARSARKKGYRKIIISREATTDSVIDKIVEVLGK